MRLKDIPRFTRSPAYRTVMPWKRLEGWIKSHVEEDNLDLNPDFQRGYVWTPQQKSLYVEYAIRGGISGKEIYLNCAGWMADFRGPFILVDGKQRIDAALGFLCNEVTICGGLRYSDFEDKLGSTPEFYLNVNDLPTWKEVLAWYVDLNSGGTIHTNEEINKVRRMMEEAE
jgi:hypothetical protein